MEKENKKSKEVPEKICTLASDLAILIDKIDKIKSTKMQ